MNEMVPATSTKRKFLWRQITLQCSSGQSLDLFADDRIGITNEFFEDFDFCEKPLKNSFFNRILDHKVQNVESLCLLSD